MHGNILKILENSLSDPLLWCENSAKIDQLLGLKITLIEKSLFLQKEKGLTRLQKKRTWIGLDIDDLQTTYQEFYNLLKFAKDSYKLKEIIDLGCGYGRLGFISSLFFPEINFKGFDSVVERIEEVKRVSSLLCLQNFEVKCEDIIGPKFNLPLADAYFIYEFSSPVEMKMMLEKLGELSRNHHFIVVARGRGINSLIQKYSPWLTLDKQSLCLQKNRIYIF